MTIKGILSDESINIFWAQFDTDVFSAIEKMSDVDKAWALDRLPQILKACEILGERMSDERVMASANHRRIFQPDDAKIVLDVMSNLQTARGLRIYRWLEAFQPVFAAEMLEIANNMDEDNAALLFMERVRVLNKLHLISRIFSYNRLKMLIDQLSDIRAKGAVEKQFRQQVDELKDKEKEGAVTSFVMDDGYDYKDDDDDEDSWG